MSTLTPSRPVQVDTELAEIYRQEMLLHRNLSWSAVNIHRLSGSEEQSYYIGRERFSKWNRTLVEAMTAGPAHEYQASQWEEAQRDRFDYQTQVAQLKARKEELDAEFQQAPWTRFFIVSGGHIHSSMNCSTCNRQGHNTLFGWLPELSGLTEKDAVEAEGALLCTVCFPSAPVEWTNQLELDEAAKQAASCPGSGKLIQEPRSYGRTGYRVCSDCGEQVSYTTTGKFRKHKKG